MGLLLAVGNVLRDDLTGRVALIVLYLPHEFLVLVGTHLFATGHGLKDMSQEKLKANDFREQLIGPKRRRVRFFQNDLAYPLTQRATGGF
jgi:hypothetical protein